MSLFYIPETYHSGMCVKRVCLTVLVAALLLLAMPASASPALTINSSTTTAHIGDTILLDGTVTGINTIAVYLFVTGDGLDSRGVALDNLNIPAGRGMFTTAPVQIADGSWTYAWDTSIIVGTLKPGNYTVYVVGSPVDRQRFLQTEYATAEITFLPSDRPVAETPLDPVLAVAGSMGAVILCAAGLRRE
ncbi:MAG: hypothetical protein WCX22_06570 [Methanoregula sp.]